MAVGVVMCALDGLDETDSFFFFNDTATTEIYTLSLHDALPISSRSCTHSPRGIGPAGSPASRRAARRRGSPRSEEHTSELQSQSNLVCRLLLEKKNVPACENWSGFPATRSRKKACSRSA